MNKDLVCMKDEVKSNNIIKLYKNIWGSGSGRTNALLNIIYIMNQILIELIYAKDSYNANYQLLINKRKSADLKYLNDSKAFIEYSNHMYHIRENTVEYNTNKKRKILIFFDDMIADMLIKS